MQRMQRCMCVHVQMNLKACACFRDHLILGQLDRISNNSTPIFTQCDAFAPEAICSTEDFF